MRERVLAYVTIALIAPAFLTSAVADAIQALLLSRLKYSVGGRGYYLIGTIVFVSIWALLFGLLLYVDPRKPDRPRRRKGFDVLPPK